MQLFTAALLFATPTPYEKAPSLDIQPIISKISDAIGSYKAPEKSYKKPTYVAPAPAYQAPTPPPAPVYQPPPPPAAPVYQAPPPPKYQPKPNYKPKPAEQPPYQPSQSSTDTSPP